ncbi:hypothetical protein CH35J_006180 [Colletotrichum higginsianum]|uniref:Uncharacterized protein n=1 Tax=Colletotrichum higginsianum TaxID=80884 RepID=A0A4T0W4N2_9PEZI|nr:hypothetical protein CH35J_006180 [Colletotrichum higginsianum]
MLDQHVIQAVTLPAVLLGFTIKAEAFIYTSLIAGIVLDRYNIPLSRVAEIQVIRLTNDRPLRLAWLLGTSARSSALQVGLAILLLLTTLVVHFHFGFLLSEPGPDVSC